MLSLVGVYIMINVVNAMGVCILKIIKNSVLRIIVINILIFFLLQSVVVNVTIDCANIYTGMHHVHHSWYVYCAALSPFHNLSKAKLN